MAGWQVVMQRLQSRLRRFDSGFSLKKFIVDNNYEKVLVTGADGFIGSHLTEILAASGNKVKALSQYL